MEIAIPHPQFVDQRLAVQPAGVFRRPKVLLNGTPVTRTGRVYKVANDAGDEVELRLGRSLLDALPPLTVGGVKVRMARPLRWYEYVWIGLPAILLIGGFVGALIASFACYSSSRIIRGPRNAVTKYVLSGLVTLSAFVAFAVFAGLIQGLTGGAAGGSRPPTPNAGTVPSVSARVGGVTVVLPVPPGYTEPSLRVPMLWQFAEQFVAAPNRLLAFFVVPEDMTDSLNGKPAQLIRRYMVEVNTDLENRAVTTAEFSRLRDQMKTQWNEILAKAESEAQMKLREKSREFASRSGVKDMAIGVDHLVPIAVLDEDAGAITTVGSMNSSNTSNGEITNVPTVFSMTFTLVRGKLLTLLIYSNYTSKADLDWVKEQARPWVASLHQLN